MSTDTIRSTVAAELGHPFHEQGFTLVDVIVANVTEGEVTPESTRHEVAAELTDMIVDGLDMIEQATLWVVLAADGEGLDHFGTYGDTEGALPRIRLDLFVVIERAVHAGLVARAEAEEVGA